MNEMVECSSCGAWFHAGQVRCPYCGTAYEPAAEEEYMGKLEGGRAELSGHKGDASKSTAKALLRAVVIFFLAVMVILFLGFSIFILPARRHRERKQEDKTEFLQKNSVDSVEQQTQEE